jgi:gas vesicle protein
MKRRSDRHNESDIEEHSLLRDIGMVIAGISIGSGIALLVAPNSGEEVRRAIGRRYHRAKKSVGRGTEDLRDRVGELLEDAGDLRSLLRRREAERRSRAA